MPSINWSIEFILRDASSECPAESSEAQPNSIFFQIKGETPASSAGKDDMLFAVIVSKDHAGLFESLDVPIIQLDEQIDKKGKIIRALTESEINRVLRQVYQYPQARILLHLTNSMANPLHEETMSRLLRTAGYKHVFSSHKPLKSISLLPGTDGSMAKPIPESAIEEYIQFIQNALGPGSVLKLNPESK